MICKPTSRSLRIALALGALAATAWPTLAAEKTPPAAAPAALRLNELEYLEMPGLNVMLAHDYYPEGHQGGVGIIQNGLRVATNGDLRLDRTPGQWQPVPKVGKRVVDKATGEISLRAEYPDESKNRKGFNPVDYPDLRFAYTVRVRPEGQAFRILVDLEQPLPDEWIGRVGFNLELFPGHPLRQDVRDRDADRHLPPAGQRPGHARREGRVPDRAARHGEAARHRPRVRPPADDHRGRERRRARARGRPRPAQQRLVRGALARREGRDEGRRGVARDAPRDPRLHRGPHRPGLAGRLPPEAAEVGDRRDWTRATRGGCRSSSRGSPRRARSRRRCEAAPQPWGRFLRYDYLRLDFTSVEKPGMYVVSYGDARSNPFRIGADVYAAPRLAADGRVLPADPDVPRARERALPRVARRLPPRRRAHGAGGPQPLRRLPAGTLDADEVRAGRAGAGARPRRLARRRRRRPARRVAGRDDARPRARLGGVPPGPRRHHRSTRSSASSRCTSPTASPTCCSRSSTARSPWWAATAPLGRFYRGIISPDAAPVHAPRRLRGADRQRRVRPEDGAGRGRPRSGPASRARPTTAGCSPSRTRAGS